jgi:tetratricopeptide (TPR) repeat protein
VQARHAHGPKTSDLRQYDDGEDPLTFLICLCPGCGYAGEATAFEALAPDPAHEVPADLAGAFWDQAAWEDAHDPVLAGDRGAAHPTTLRALVDAHLRPRAGQAHSSPPLAHEHAAQVLRWLGAGPLREGDAMLRAAWLWEDAGDAAAGRRCRERALGLYRRAIQEQRWFRRREDLVVVTYLSGELERRLGRAEEARRLFEQAIRWSMGLPQLQELVALCERQLRDPREIVR